MYDDVCRMLYGYIIEVELLFLRMYGINPFDIMRDMTIIDMNVYLSKIQEKEKKEQDSIKKTDIMKSLYAIYQILSMMFYKKK